MNIPDWNELTQSEEPATRLLEELGYKFVASESLEEERESHREVVLEKRLSDAIKRLNPWISEENVKKVVRELTLVTAASVMEANEKVYNSIVYGMTVDQDLGQGKKSHTVKVLDFGVRVIASLYT